MAKIIALTSYLPKELLTNDELELLFPAWKSEKIFAKTGIRTRHIANSSQGSEDLAFAASEKLFKENKNFNKNNIDSLIVLTQTPSQIIPSSACKIHAKLELKEDCSAFDINQGCAGYVYGLQVAQSMIHSKSAEYILLITSDVYSKIINRKEANLSTLFGDGATATLIGPEEKNISATSIGPFQFGTDGSKFEKLICTNNLSNLSENKYLYMDGPSILEFTLKKVPYAINKYLEKNSFSIDDFDYVIFHQANKFILEKLYKKIGLTDKGLIEMIDSGNTASSSIPLALEKLISRNNFKKSNILLVGFGSGLSWGITSIKI